MKIKRFNEAQEQLSDAERKFLAALFEMKPEIEDFVSSVNKLIQVGEIESDVAAKFMIEIGEDPDQLDLPVVSSTSHLVDDDEDDHYDPGCGSTFTTSCESNDNPSPSRIRRFDSGCGGSYSSNVGC